MENEEQKRILENILSDFNAIVTKSMTELSNGSDHFTLSRGAWTVSLDIEGYINRLNEAKERAEIMSGIISESVEKWHEKLGNRKEQDNEVDGNEE